MIDKPPSNVEFYEIRLKGHLDTKWVTRFDSLTITLEENGNTLLSGPVADQAALHTLLKKIRDLGVTLISVNRIKADHPDAPHVRHPINIVHKKEQNMKSLQKFGGIAALIGAATNLFALVMFAALLVPNGFGSEPRDLGRIVAFLADNQAFMRVFDMIIYLVFGISLIFLSLALYDRLKAGAPALVQAVTTFGLIYAVLVIVVGTLAISNLSTVVKLYGENPAQAATAWLTLDSVETGLGGGGGETVVSALWILLLSCAALQARELPRVLNYLGLVVGAAGILGVLLTSLNLMAVVYGLGLIIWLAWLGIVLLFSNPGKIP